jgi:hypothetical protein
VFLAHIRDRLFDVLVKCHFLLPSYFLNVIEFI